MDLGGRVGPRNRRALAEEGIALHVDVVLGPGANMKRSPLSGRNKEWGFEGLVASDWGVVRDRVAVPFKGLQTRAGNAEITYAEG